MEEFFEEDTSSDSGDEAVMHYHGDFEHSHKGGGESHTHEEHAGTYKKEKSSSKDTPKMEKKVTESLGLSEDASVESVVGAIVALKTSTFTENERQDFEAMRTDRRMSHWQAETESHKLAPGTTLERAKN